MFWYDIFKKLFHLFHVFMYLSASIINSSLEDFMDLFQENKIFQIVPKIWVCCKKKKRVKGQLCLLVWFKGAPTR